MTSLVQALADRVVGAVERVTAGEITVLLDPDSPQATALNTGTPSGFPRLNGYVLVPNESGATVGIVSEVRIERLPYPKRKGMQDFGLVDLPFPSRMLRVIPLGTLEARTKGGDLSFRVRRGIDVFPSVGDSVAIPTLEQLRAIVTGDDDDTSRSILIGRCPTAGRAAVHVNPDKLFGRHLAVLGNTGAGKSCSVAGLVRWSVAAAREARRQRNSCERCEPNARFIILDPNGEYAKAFTDLRIRLFQVDPTGGAAQLKVPAWLWNGQEWAAFTGAAPGVQRPLLLEALRRLRSEDAEPDAFATRVRRMVRVYRGALAQRISNGDHVAQGRREGVAQLLISTADEFQALARDGACPAGSKVSLEAVASTATKTEVDSRQSNSQPRQYHNEITEVRLAPLRSAFEAAAALFSLGDGDVPVSEDVPKFFPVEHLPTFVEALAVDGANRDMAQFVDALMLRIRSMLARGRLARVIQPPDSRDITLEQWLGDHIGEDDAGNGPIAVVDLSLVPSDVVHVVVAVLARMVFEATQRYRRETGTELPTTLVLEEAHTFVHQELSAEGGPPAARACYRTFERIAREGRKFGLGLVLASQRPSELSPTVLSQCNTFLLHRIVNDRDQDLVRRLVPDALGDLLRELPTRPSRRAILLGWAAPAPVLVEIEELPDAHRPHSPDPKFWDVWTGVAPRPIDWSVIARDWSAGRESSRDQ
jgi:uncharacterized protein